MRSLRIFLACALGAGVGSLIALQLQAFWFVGALVGGLVGYLAYDFNAVVKAFPGAWGTACERMRENPIPWGKLLAGLVWTLNVAVGLAIGVLIYQVFPDQLGVGPGGIYSFLAIFLVALVLLYTAGCYGFEALLDETCRVFSLPVPKWGEGIWMENPYSAWLILVASPLIFAIAIGSVIVMVILLFAIYAYGAAVAISEFTWTLVKRLFIAIHSDIRLLCGIDALIGSIVGLATGNVIVGALFGGLLGVVNYEIISKRLLHLHQKPVL